MTAAATAIAPRATARYMPVAEVAKHLRTALKATFPAVKFSVRSRSYSMGASIDVAWTDGPTRKEVDAITEGFAGATFDGMQDLKEHKGAMIMGGEYVRSGADFIFTRRELSDAGWLSVAELVATTFNVPVPAKDRADSSYPVIGSHFTFQDYVHQASCDSAEFIQRHGLTF